MPNIVPFSNFKKPKLSFDTKYVIFISIDGIRYSEAWGETDRPHVPYMNAMLENGGILFSNFMNNGQTVTNPGHAAVSTGKYQDIANDGSQYPDSPSIFQQYRKFATTNQTDCFLITSKDKLVILDDTAEPTWTGTFAPSSDCGVNGDGTGGYRSDALTYNHIINAIDTYHPHITFVNLKGPDEAAHTGVFSAYVGAISACDLIVNNVWTHVQADPIMQDKTTLVVFTDHGRHLTGVSNGFIGHGDTCEGCKHTFCFMTGPDFKENITITDEYEPIDIAPTICAILGFKMSYNTGQVISSIFKPK